MTDASQILAILVTDHLHNRGDRVASHSGEYT